MRRTMATALLVVGLFGTTWRFLGTTWDAYPRYIPLRPDRLNCLPDRCAWAL